MDANQSLESLRKRHRETLILLRPEDKIVFHISPTHLHQGFSPIIARKHALAVAYYLDISEVHIQGKFNR